MISLKSARVALKDTTNQQNNCFQNNSNKVRSSQDKCNHSKQSCINQDNRQNDEVHKKIRLKLKSVSSRQIPKKQNSSRDLPNNVNQDRIKNKKLKENNSVTKINKNSALSQRITSKKGEICYFKPSFINVSLKSLSQNAKADQYLKSQKCSRQNDTERIEKIERSQNYAISSFVTEFISKLDVNFPIFFSSQQNTANIAFYQLNYDQLIKILYSLGMIKYPSEQQYNLQITQEKQQLQKIFLLWQMLKSSSSNLTSITIINLTILLSATLNLNVNTHKFIGMFLQKLQIHFQHKVQQKIDSFKNILEITSRSCQEPTQIFFIRNKKLLNSLHSIQVHGYQLISMSSNVFKQISKQFESFRLNRLRCHHQFKSIGESKHKKQQEEVYDVGRLISPRSKQLALQKRLKILQQLQKSQDKGSQYMSYHNGPELNIFLNYKSSKKSTDKKKNQDIQQSSSKNTKPNSVFKQKTKANEKNTCLLSQKIKFSQLNSILKMQKGRQIKQQKQKILQKGWTNSGKLTDRQQKKSQSEFNHQSYNHTNLKTEKSSKSLSKKKTSNYFENRKQSFHYAKKINDFEVDRNSQNKIFGKRKNTAPIKDLMKDIFEVQNSERKVSQRMSVYSISMEDDESINLQSQRQNDEQNEFIQMQRTDDQYKEDSTTKIQQYSQEKTQPLITQNCNTFQTQANQQQQEILQTRDQCQAKQKLTPNQKRTIKSYLKIPILYVDVNMDESKKERIVIFQEDNPLDLAREFGKKHKLDNQMIVKLQEMLTEQINGILGRIDEQEEQYDQTKDDVFQGLQPRTFDH